MSLSLRGRRERFIKSDFFIFAKGIIANDAAFANPFISISLQS